MPFALSEEELRKTEALLGAELPDGYRSKMMRSNGGEVEAFNDVWELFPIQDQLSKKLISRTCNHILKETQSAQEWPNFHENALAIASNGEGDCLVIFQAGKKFEPEIFAWFHEDGALVTVASSFSELEVA